MKSGVLLLISSSVPAVLFLTPFLIKERLLISDIFSLVLSSHLRIFSYGKNGLPFPATHFLVIQSMLKDEERKGVRVKLSLEWPVFLMVKKKKRRRNLSQLDFFTIHPYVKEKGEKSLTLFSLFSLL